MYFSQDNMVHTAEDMNCVHGIPAYCADFVMNDNVGGVNAAIQLVAGRHKVFCDGRPRIQSLAIAASPLQAAFQECSHHKIDNWPITSIVLQLTSCAKLYTKGGAV